MRIEFQAQGRLGKRGKIDGENQFVVFENHFGHKRYASVVSIVLPNNEAVSMIGKKAKVTVEIEE